MQNHPKLSLIQYFQGLPDPRLNRTKDHDLIDLWRNRDTNKVGVYRLPKHLDEEVVRSRTLRHDKPVCTSTASA